jgi:hypothetical protein
MSSSDSANMGWATDETLATVRPEVREILAASAGFRQMAPEEQRELARTMVKVASYMSNPDGLAARELGSDGGVLARAQDDGVAAVKSRLARDPGFAGATFQAGALRQGTQQFGELVKKVNFADFVGGLIQNVFQAIVQSSLQQMRAYADLLANVSKTVDQFAQDNITLNNARDWLTQRFPDKLGVDASGIDSSFADSPGTPVQQPAATPRITVTADDAEGALKDISNELQMAKPVTDISDPAEEERLVTAAQLQIARGRQQLLASMVMLGINRIVVTDGLIHAKVVFDMVANDNGKRAAKASMYDKTDQQSSAGFGGGGIWGLGGIGGDYSNSSDHLTTVESSVDDTSESKAQLKANLTGEVRVNFKSDYFPMDKLANPQMISAIQGNAVPPDKPVKGA